MGIPGTPLWDLDCPLIDELTVDATAVDFSSPGNEFFWNSQPINGVSDCCIEPSAAAAVECTSVKESGCNKRPREESLPQPSSKACREKLRRDKLNERFLELGSVLEPGKTPKLDKTAILNDAIRMVTELRSESQRLKDSKDKLQEKIKELKAEKNELRDEKQRLKAEKESLEQQIKMLSAHPNLVAHPPVIPTAFAAQGQTAPLKLMPFLSYPGFPIWQFMPPSDVDTSQDPKSCPPVA